MPRTCTSRARTPSTPILTSRLRWGHSQSAVGAPRRNSESICAALAPDADLQAAKDVLAWVQDALADDQRDQVLERSRQAEEHLTEKVRAALDEDVPSDTRALLEQLSAVPELRAALGLI